MHGGLRAIPGQFKAIVFIYVEWSYLNISSDEPIEYNQNCTGTIISPKWVLTAAHCLPEQHLLNRYYRYNRFEIINTSISVTAGCVNIRSHHCHHNRADKFITHERAVRPINSQAIGAGVDVALLRMKRSFRFTNRLGPVALLGSHMPYKVTNMCVAAGFGNQFHEDTSKHMKTDGRLYYVHLTAGNYNYCREIALRPNNARKFQICSHNDKDERQMTCQGDSGSPLLCGSGSDMVSVGVLMGSTALESDNIRCGDEEQDDLYTGTAFIKKWIRKKTLDHLIVFNYFLVNDEE